MAKTIGDYLTGGGYVYLEGGDALGYDQASNNQLLGLFGIASSIDGTTNPIDSLHGQTGTLAELILFTGSTQHSVSYIDRYIPSANGEAAFIENGYGTVAIQNNMPGAHRTFCFSYALAELEDGENPNTREHLLERILNFFDIYTAEPPVRHHTADSFNIYPNPANDRLTISAPGLSGYTIITLFTLSGQQAMELRITGSKIQIDISTLPRGVYFVRVQDERMIEVTKLVKQ